MEEHVPVLLREALENLAIKPDGIYVDLTVGRAGHSSAILKQLTTGKLFGFDQDHTALEASKKRLAAISSNFELIDANFAKVRSELEARGIHSVNGILMDLGVSSPQFDEADRGFSYRFEAPLDMRMDADNPLTAARVVNTYELRELTRVIRDYGDEKHAYEIAKAIVKTRSLTPILTTKQLVDVIKKALPLKELSKKGHPAKQTFQALRIEVNHELEVLTVALNEASGMLAKGGRLVVITFHSGEDRIVKNFFKSVSVVEGSRHGVVSLIPESKDFTVLNNHKVIVPSEQEMLENHRAQSAKMRVLEKK